MPENKQKLSRQGIGSKATKELSIAAFVIHLILRHQELFSAEDMIP